MFLERLQIFFAHKNLKKHLKKLLTYGSWEIFFSAALTAQNSPKLHFRFTNSFIQSSRVESLWCCNHQEEACMFHTDAF